MNEMSAELLGEINKRFTLNMLIQGVATHTLLTAHHLVGEELAEIHPELVHDYDRFAVSMFLNLWIGDIALMIGRPRRFWKRTSKPSHPFHRHRLLATHGGELSHSFKQYLNQRATAKGVRRVPLLHMAQQIRLVVRVLTREDGQEYLLEQLARRTTSQIWSIGEDRLDAELSTKTEFGNIRTPVSWQGKVLRRGAVGWGGVQQRENRLIVVAKAQCWPLLVHELVKGTAELICLHGLNHLPADMYEQVLDVTDHIEHESWHMQTGVELWRRLLALLPAGKPLSETLMSLARLEPESLEELMLAVADQSNKARTQLAQL